MNQDVIALRDEFGVPADDHRFRVINADGAAYISILAHCKDAILADACDRTGVAAALGSVEFYRKPAAACLSVEYLSPTFVATKILLLLI